MIEDGTITEEQAVDHPKKHLITRAVGVDSTVRADFCQEDINSGDIVLLCTDGLTNYSTVDDIVLSAVDSSLDEYVSKLVNKAIEHGGGDNVTVVAISV